MPFTIIRDDITNGYYDAIVNTTNRRMICAGDGVDAAIHEKAGAKLQEACLRIGFCEVGQAKITPGFELNSRFVIHTVGPHWSYGADTGVSLLISCYRSVLALAKENGCESLALPLISTGAHGFPKRLALDIATKEIKAFLQENDMNIFLVLHDAESWEIGQELIDEVNEALEAYESNSWLTYSYSTDEDEYELAENQASFTEETVERRTLFSDRIADCRELPLKEKTLEEELNDIDESFADMLFRKIDELGIKDSVCYKKANVDKKVFSKIRSNKKYHPKKTTVVAFAFALQLSFEETKSMIEKAGYSLSHSSQFDIIVEHFIKKGVYDIFKINEVLYYYDQPLLGSNME
jgi:O-acetyl-ADP-ribose deacetylase (regulator of RNase III)